MKCIGVINISFMAIMINSNLYSIFFVQVILPIFYHILPISHFLLLISCLPCTIPYFLSAISLTLLFIIAFPLSIDQHKVVLQKKVDIFSSLFYIFYSQLLISELGFRIAQHWDWPDYFLQFIPEYESEPTKDKLPMMT